MPSSADDSQKVSREYLQWKQTQQLLQHLKRRTSDLTRANHRNEKTKTESQFGRWLMAMQFYNCDQLDERFPLFPRQTWMADVSKQGFVKALQDSFVDIKLHQATELANELLSMIDRFLRENLEPKDDVETPEVKLLENDSGAKIIVGQFRTPYSSRIKPLVDQFGLVSTALVCMRYASLNLFRGGESGLSVTVVNALRDLGGATHEGFASPINCRLLGRPGTTFCSLFADTDSAFGSLGNFFRINLKEHPGGWIVNPPFVELVMEEAARVILDLLQETEPGSFWFYVVFPMWRDNKGWQALDDSDKKVQRIDLAENTTFLQDCYGEVLWRQMSMCIFVLGELPANADLPELQRRVRADRADTVSCTIIASGSGSGSGFNGDNGRDDGRGFSAGDRGANSGNNGGGRDRGKGRGNGGGNLQRLYSDVRDRNNGGGSFSRGYSGGGGDNGYGDGFGGGYDRGYDGGYGDGYGGGYGDDYGGGYRGGYGGGYGGGFGGGGFGGGGGARGGRRGSGRHGGGGGRGGRGGGVES